ncbi:chemotaxis protein CheW [Polyangium aurulentum]|uniref:chemotaxis protein CheW n=1 Tax=Polyangium aurulentum TaxID=2567896 RepID=UPI0010AEA1B7|nr:chemotaxis protein CheW [Polyangium aurulentum]UQA62432.1 chemotaxis protein CheW [Polyangium aurulentum]
MRSSSKNDVSLLDGLGEDEIELLRMRAMRYAERIDDGTGDIAEVVVFRRGTTQYAVPISVLREVRPLRSMCRIPGASLVVPGIVHFRGEILSLHDLEAFMDPTAGGRPAAWVIVAENAGERIGIIADEVLGIEQFAATRVRPPPVTFGERGIPFEGVIDGGVLLLSAERMFDTPSFFSAF